MSKLVINFLGTGPAVAIPRLGHHDSTCRDAKRTKSRTRRLRSSLLITYKNTSILVDAGPDFLAQSKNITGKLAAAFLTHEHEDACGGLHDLRAWAATKKLSLPLYCLPKTWKKIADEFSPLKPAFVKPNKSIKVGDLIITPFCVRHGIKHNVPTLGFQIAVPIILPIGRIIGTGKFNTTNGTIIDVAIDTAKSDKKIAGDERIAALPIKIIYASDMDGAPLVSKKIFREANLIIIDSAMWFGRKLNGHFNPEQAIKFLKSLLQHSHILKNVRMLVVLTQIGHSWPPYDKAVRELALYCKKQKIPFPVSVAYDNLRIKI